VLKSKIIPNKIPPSTKGWDYSIYHSCDSSVTIVQTVSVWPDVVVGLGIFVMNLDAAREVFVATRAEHVDAKA